MRAGFFSPLPPERSGIADYSYELLEELRHLCDVTAVVSDDLVGIVVAPDGVGVVGESEVPIGTFDCNVYQMGNNAKFHRFIYRRALNEPGLLVMHDPSLADFHSEICNGSAGVVFRDEVAHDRPDLDLRRQLPTVDVGDGRRDLDRLEILMARRIVEASRQTLLNSAAMAELYSDRYPESQVAAIRLPGRLVAPHMAEPGDRVVFGVFGGINYYKRVLPALEAFHRVHEEYPNTEAVFAGRADDPRVEAALYARVAQYGLEESVLIETDLTLIELEAEMARCDVAIQLRWPTAGEMSATLMRTFGAGRPAVVSDVPQFADLDRAYCWRVPVGGEAEVDELARVMCTVAADPTPARAAGLRARQFIAEEANYAAVAAEYLRYLEAAMTVAPVRSEPWHLQVAPYSWAVNLISPDHPTFQTAAMSRLLRDALAEAGVSVWTGTRSTIGQIKSSVPGGPHEIDLFILGDNLSDDVAERLNESVGSGRGTIGFVAPTSFAVDRNEKAAIAKLDMVWAPTWAGTEIARLHGASDVALVPLWPTAVATRPTSRSQDAVAVLAVIDGGGPRTQETARLAVDSVRRSNERKRSDSAINLVVSCRGLGSDEEWRVRQIVEPRGGTVVVFGDDDELIRVVDGCDVLLVTEPEPLGLASLVAARLGRTVVTYEGPGMPDFRSWPGVAVVQSLRGRSSGNGSDVADRESATIAKRGLDLDQIASAIARIADGGPLGPQPWIPDAPARIATVHKSIERLQSVLAARPYRRSARELAGLS